MTAVVRPATPADVGAIFALMYELAEYEKLTHLFVATEAGLNDALFGPRTASEALVADDDGRVVATPSSSTTSRPFSAGAGSTSKTCTCSRRSAARGSAKPC